jgi:glycosyltransferase involved in cell wall biosynthesis
MATGIATVASPVGVTTDLIRHEFNGLLATSPEQWICALERLLQDDVLRRKLTANARRTIEDSYSLQIWGPRLVALFDQLCAAPHSLQPAATAA